MERTSGEHISRFVEMPTGEETCQSKFLELRHYNADVDDFIHNKAIEFSKQNITLPILFLLRIRKRCFIIQYFK